LKLGDRGFDPVPLAAQLGKLAVCQTGQRPQLCRGAPGFMDQQSWADFFQAEAKAAATQDQRHAGNFAWPVNARARLSRAEAASCIRNGAACAGLRRTGRASL
jgi:hypothetical protein